MNKLTSASRSMFAAMAILAASFFPARAALNFATSSQLAQGNWAKVGVTENGVYEITYDQLRELGFTDPSKVCVWGEGGIMYGLDFQDRYNNRKIPDSLSAVSVLHKNNKIYFYAKGPENLSWVSDSKLTSGMRRASTGLNIYSNYGIYFLSDTQNPVDVKICDAIPSGTDHVHTGLSYIYYEKDINQGDAYSSQEFWGEDFMDMRNFTQLFPYKAAGMAADPQAALSVRFMAQSGYYQPLYYGLEGDDANRIATRTGYVSSISTYYRINETLGGNVNLASKTGNVKIEAPDNGILTLQKRLDWWTLSYMRNLDFDEDENQFYAYPLFLSVANVKIPQGDVEVWDVSSPYSPLRLQADENGLAGMNHGRREMVFFRTSMEQKKPMLMEKVSNQNLHALASSVNPAMIIFTTDTLAPYAQQLADFHKEYEGKEVIVVTAKQIYNEFSAGRPDPMAYRSFAKMMHDKPGSALEAVLFYGPLRSNVRKQDPDGQMNDLLIAYQSELGLTAVNTNCIMDVYGMLGDSPISTTSASTLNSYGTSIILATPMDIAVAVMPVLSPLEAKRVNEKTINYALNPDKPYWSDRIIYMADDYDDALHVTQSERMANAFQSISRNNATLVKAYAGEYGKTGVVDKLFDAYNEGAIVNNYIGHGSTSSVGMTEFLQTADVLKMRNPRHTFMNFAGCMATMYENGIRGIPEHMFLSSDYGLVGGQLSVRTSYANENENYMTVWQQFLLNGYDNKYRPITTGEAARRTKNYIIDTNGKMKFHLFGDPLLRLPVATAQVNVTQWPDTVTIGAPMKLSGRVILPNGAEMKDFQGKLVAKWIEAPHKEKIMNKISGYKGGTGTSHPSGYKDSTIYREKIITTETFEVKNGSFDIDINVPELLGAYIGDSAYLSIVAYDVEHDITAWNSALIPVAAASEDVMPDTEAPVIEVFELSGADNGVVRPSFNIHAVITDNNGLRIDEVAPDMPLALILDGTRISNIPSFVAMEEGSKRLLIHLPRTDVAIGHHTLELHVCDYAGLRSSAKINFEVRLDKRLPAPRLQESICSEKATIIVDQPGEGNATLIITDAAGREVIKMPYTSQTIWNLKNEEEKRVDAGIYKAYIKYTSTSGNSNTTHPLTIPVLSVR